MSELEEERRLRAEEAVSRAKMADEVAELTSMVADLKVHGDVLMFRMSQWVDDCSRIVILGRAELCSY